MTRKGRPPQRKTRWNPITAQIVINYLYRTNTYLHRDWSRAKPFIHEHYYLWYPGMDETWHRRIYIEDLHKDMCA